MVVSSGSTVRREPYRDPGLLAAHRVGAGRALDHAVDLAGPAPARPRRGHLRRAGTRRRDRGRHPPRRPGLRPPRRHRVSELLIRLGTVLDEGAVRQRAVDPRGVLRDLGLDLTLQVNTGHRGQAEQVNRDIREFLAYVLASLAPGVESFGYLP